MILQVPQYRNVYLSQMLCMDSEKALYNATLQYFLSSFVQIFLFWLLEASLDIFKRSAIERFTYPQIR